MDENEDASDTKSCLSGIGSGSGVPIFDGDRFQYWIWRSRMMDYLGLLRLWNVMKDDAENPERSELWTTQNNSARHHIISHLSDSLMLEYVKEDGEQSARDIITAMDEKFFNNPATALALRFKLDALQFKTPLHKLFAEYETLLRHIEKQGQSVSTNDKIYVLLSKMPSQYRFEVNAIRANTDPAKHTLDHVMKMFLARETNLELDALINPTKLPQTMPKRGRGRGGRGMSRGRGYFNSYNYNGYSAKIPRCMHCNRPGHIQKDCVYYKRCQFLNNFNVAADPFQDIPDYPEMKYQDQIYYE